ncbi:MAG: Crp/Fnr family transcriptional regulator [Wenzhouxiangellaceae bacterium]|nr:Crp/Fnr family transcriptional regulator [Wenzhouxiangellaceae bacterium]MBS3822943.1 Crp/Fnr family transcriptional regulator [Wenzhouxiangellaceae bacterium]
MLERKMVPVEQIRQFRIFRNLGDEIVSDIRRSAWIKSLAADEVLFRQNDPVRRTYFCLSGQVKLFRLTRAGSEKIFTIASSGDSLRDSISLKPGRLYPLHCTAISTSEMLSIDPEFIADICHRSPDARASLIDALEQRIDELVDHAELLSVDKAGFRVASYLLNEYRRNGNEQSFRLGSSKKYVASYLSLQPETLSRCLRHFRQNGIASSVNRRIEIHDPERLEQIVNGVDAAA